MTSDYSLSRLRRGLAEWFGRNARALPWRETTDPYHIWLSEVILQQTQVVQGLGYYHRFLEAFPTIEDLASASEDEVLRLWQGLGYYSRGRNLRRAAQMVVSDFGGRMPQNIEEIKRLPGVGPYTQAAVLSFAYNLPYAAVDGNVYRVLSRLYAIDTPIDTTKGQREFRLLAQELLDPIEPGLHNQAMIELGALCCTPRRPRCHECPLATFCLAREEGRQAELPRKQGKVRVTSRYLNYLLVLLPEGQTLIRRRGEGDIWQGLYELPLIETPKPVTAEQLLSHEDMQSLLEELEQPQVQLQPVATRKHRLTHRLLEASLTVVRAKGCSECLRGTYHTIALTSRASYGMPILLDKLIATFQHQDKEQ
ncbi:MAG: A/G-specific adenine glycosylase [Porphyromonadaceae bacterium]|nr:A/G-specific adenine glycosylase [Porphyromonadaceae bacterium]